MSKYQFKLPDIGEGIAEGVIGKWHVKVGDTVKEDEDLVQIENDKSVEEIPSPVAGKVTKILVDEGDTAEVGQALVELEVASGQSNVSDDDSSKQATATPEAPKEEPAKIASIATESHLPVLAMPAVRKYANEHDVDLTQLSGTGRHGQITKADVDTFLQSGNVAVKQATPAEVTLAKPSVSTDASWPETVENMSMVRKATAEHMVKAVDNIPHVYVFDEVVVDDLWDHRNKYKEMAAKRGVKLTFMAYMVKALAVIMKEYPVLNSSVDMQANTINYKDYINVGIATDTQNGLFVPNIKHADSLSLFKIAEMISDNTQKAKEGKLSRADMSHTGMTITNIGSVGGGFFTPIINWPEVAILGMGKISKEPVVADDADLINISRVLKLSLGFDHRVIDGATAQKAVNRLKELLSDPELLLMEG